MTHENREKLSRAIGVIEGAAYCASPKVLNALSIALDMLEEVLEKEEKQ